MANFYILLALHHLYFQFSLFMKIYHLYNFFLIFDYVVHFNPLQFAETYSENGE